MIALFDQDYHRRFYARCGWEFVLGNLAALARADGDGFSVLTAEFEGVVIVTVDEKLGDSVLEIEAWGDFVAATQ